MYGVAEMHSCGGMGLGDALDAFANSCADRFARSAAWVLELSTSAAEPSRHAQLPEDRIALLLEAPDPAEVVEGASFFRIFFDRQHPRPELASRAIVEHVIAAKNRRGGFCSCMSAAAAISRPGFAGSVARSSSPLLCLSSAALSPSHGGCALPSSGTKEASGRLAASSRPDSNGITPSWCRCVTKHGTVTAGAIAVTSAEYVSIKSCAAVSLFADSRCMAVIRRTSSGEWSGVKIEAKVLEPTPQLARTRASKASWTSGSEMVQPRR